MNLNIEQSADTLKAQLFQLEERGQTALGPAVATAVGMASEGAAGSIVIVCTDGLANVGVGSFDKQHSQ